MKIFNLFKKGGGEEEQDEIDKIIQENVTAEESGKSQEEAPSQKISAEDQPDAIKKLAMSVDKASAQIEILKALGKGSDERFQRLSEELGELRRAGLERGKAIDKTRLKAEKAAGLVEQVQPQNLMKEVEKEDAKIEVLGAKEKIDRELLDHITNELKTLKSNFSAFRGMEALIELNNDMKNDLKTIKKTELRLKQHADKVETLFVKLQRGFDDYSKQSQEFKSLEKNFQETLAESEKFKREQQDVAKKSDLAKLQADLDKKLEFVDKTKKDFIKKRQELEKLIPKIESSSSQTEKLEERLRRRLTEIDDELAGLNRLKDAGYVTEDRFNQELGDFFDNILKKIEALESKVRRK